MPRRRGTGNLAINLTSFMDIITSVVGNVLLIIISMILCATENPVKDIVIKVKQMDNIKEKRVRYVETTREGITILPIGQKVSVGSMEMPNSGFMEFLKMLNREEEYIIFAIRPNGYKSFQKARDLAEKNQIEVGYEPIDKLWNLVGE